MTSKQLLFGGVNGANGMPLLPRLTPKELAGLIDQSSKGVEPVEQEALQAAWETRRAAQGSGVLGLVSGIDPDDVTEAGWGAICHPNTPNEVKEALQDLVDARGGVWLEYNPSESAYDFRSRHGQGFGVVDPEKLPYYLMIVGGPDQIPFRFQYSLDNEHAVGRISFALPEDYHRYARRVIDYEQGKVPTRERRVVFFSPTHDYDEITALSSAELAAPLAQLLKDKPLKISKNEFVSYSTCHIYGENATRQSLLDLLTRPTQQPALIFTAGHGVFFEQEHPLQRQIQGALVTSEWPGPRGRALNDLPETMYLAGNHLPAAARFDGLIVFAFACYSAGTPQMSDFDYLQHMPSKLATSPFISQLPQQLLAQGALAFIGHIDRTWTFSFMGGKFGRDITTFRSTLTGILRGKPIGHALEDFNDRYADFARFLTENDEENLLGQYRRGDPVRNDLIDHWIAHNDARAYIIFGDPFVHLMPTEMPAAL